MAKSLTSAIAEILEVLVNILGSDKVYYQPPPEFLFTEFPCMLVTFNNVTNLPADNEIYLRRFTFQVVLMVNDIEDAVINLLIDNRYTKLKSIYPKNSIYHVVFDISTS